MTTRRKRIACFGEALIDFLAKPTDGTDAPRAFHQFAGGAPANVAVAVARLGGEAQFVGMFGQDMFGDFLIDSLHHAGVGTEHIARTDQANTALAFVALDGDGERHFNFYRPPAADLLFRREHFQEACFDGLASFHVCSNSLTEAEIAEATVQGMQLARAAGALVSCDLNWRPALWDRRTDPHARLWTALDAADLIKLARSELEFLAKPLRTAHHRSDEDAVLERAWQGRAQLVIVRAIDTTAAGDAFVGGLLFELARRDIDTAHFSAFLRDKDALEGALRFAAAVGALAVTRHGAFAAMPDLTQTQALLNGKVIQHDYA
jgi:fructokinase